MHLASVCVVIIQRLLHLTILPVKLYFIRKSSQSHGSSLALTRITNDELHDSRHHFINERKNCTNIGLPRNTENVHKKAK